MQKFSKRRSKNVWKYKTRTEMSKMTVYVDLFPKYWPIPCNQWRQRKLFYMIKFYGCGNTWLWHCYFFPNRLICDGINCAAIVCVYIVPRRVVSCHPFYDDKHRVTKVTPPRLENKKANISRLFFHLHTQLARLSRFVSLVKPVCTQRVLMDG